MVDESRPGKTKLAPETIQARVRENRALELRIAGQHFEAIANELGYADASGAHRAVSRGLARVNNGLLENAEELRAMEVARLDRMLRGLDKGISVGDPASINSALRISESLRKLLGLDAPTRTELTGPEGGPVQVADLASLARLNEEELALYERLCERAATAATPQP